MTFAGDSILVLLDVTPAGELAKSSAGLLGAAATVGTPVALVVSDAPGLPEAAGALGAASVLVATPGKGLTAEVLAAAIRRTGFDLVIAGNLSTDGSGGVMAAMVAELLDVPNLTTLNSVQIGEGTVSGERASDGATMQVSAELPAVISITEALPDARFPNFKGIMAAKKKPFETVTLEELGIEPEDANASRSIVLALSEKPPREAGTKIVDEGDAGEKLAEFLVQNRLV